MDPDQTAPTGVQEQSDLGPHCLFMRLQKIVDDIKHNYFNYALSGLINVSSVCIRLGFS